MIGFKSSSQFIAPISLTPNTIVTSGTRSAMAPLFDGTNYAWIFGTDGDLRTRTATPFITSSITATDSNAIQIGTNGNQALIYANGRYFLCASDAIYSSTSLTSTWTEGLASSSKVTARYVMWFNNKWVAVGGGPDGNWWTSTNGTSWTLMSAIGSGQNLNCLATDGTNLAVVGSSGSLYVSTTANNGSWSAKTSSFSTNNIATITYANGYWVMGGANSTVAYTTNINSTPTQKTVGFTNSNNVRGVAFHSGRWVVSNKMASNSQFCVSDTSLPSGTWTKRSYTGNNADRLGSDGIHLMWNEDSGVLAYAR